MCPEHHTLSPTLSTTHTHNLRPPSLPPPAGKLFPGPHLYAGAAITVLWALSAALVPAMQKGNDNARTAHIALNTVNLLLFASQIPTGLEIVGKVFQFTSWP